MTTGAPAGVSAMPSDTEQPHDTEQPPKTELAAEAKVPAGTERPAETRVPVGAELPSVAEPPAETNVPVGTEQPAGTGVPVEAELPPGGRLPAETGWSAVGERYSQREFAGLTERFRPELLAHCYRMLGSIHDAEDLVQETYLRAWRGFGGFEGRSSLRNWLYKIATMACLTALEGRARRPLPSGLGAPEDDHRVAVAAREPTVPWLQPAPDARFGFDDPAAIVAGRTAVRLAFLAALQLLPARQRAVLTLRDVLAFRSTEVAAILDTTPTAVDSALRRARSRLAQAGPVETDLAEPDELVQRRLLDDYVTAFTSADHAALVELLRADVEMEMPPTPTWFTGRDAVLGFLTARILNPGLWRMIPVRANGQPAFVVYKRAAEHRYEAYGIHVLTLIGSKVARITAFNDPSLVPAFGFAVAVEA
ncbi:RNA polymerase subunit sigma-70 [Nocardia tengchongensis]|uniref:RNA polymerase subunit sigma-70 n=1 Tax=Nocardia tengchongensis TaxID=2055889 RepID=UPI00367D748F